MTDGRMLRIALIVAGLLCSAPGFALADFNADQDLDFATAIPEPATLTLLASGAAALGGISWLRRRKK